MKKVVLIIAEKRRVCRLFIVTVLFCLTALIYCCNEEQPVHEEKPVPEDINPNKSSELAILMRRMNDYTEELRRQVIHGSLASAFPKEFLSIYTATQTDSTIKGEAYDTYASHYISSLKELFKSDSSHLQDNYERVITTCMSCHQALCPGPVRAIKKLKL